mgnify:CR=1 FL=1
MCYNPNMRKNMKKNNRKPITQNSELYFLSEVGKICPLCADDLILTKNGKKTKNYEIAHIYPLNPTLQEKYILRNCKKLSEDNDDDANKIAICVKCHKQYDTEKTVEEYEKLYEIKKSILNKTSVSSILNKMQLEEAIDNIINTLCNMDKVKGIDLKTDAVRVENKIIDSLLCFKIKNYVREYYKFVEKCFLDQNLTDQQTDNIMMTFRIAYNTAFDTYKQNQTKIFESLVSWLEVKCGANNKIACEIIISYFVQHCEVFDDISK